MSDPEKIVKQRRTSQKGASGSGKPKKYYVSLQEKVITEDVHFEDIEPSNVSEQIPQRFIKLVVLLVPLWISVQRKPPI